MKKLILIWSILAFISITGFGQIKGSGLGKPDFGTVKPTVISKDLSVSVNPDCDAIKTTYKGNDLTIYSDESYDKEVVKIDDKNYDYKLYFDKKPETNVFYFKLDGYEKYKFIYQKGTGMTGVNGNPLPDLAENLQGSYIICGNSNAMGKNGQVATIYRSKLIDDNGDSYWCESMEITDGLLAVKVSQKDMDSAVFPCELDPNLGYQTIGGSDNSGNTGYYISNRLGFAPSNGTITSMTVALSRGAGSHLIKLCVNADNGKGYPGALVTGSYTGEQTPVRTTKPTTLEQCDTYSITGTLIKGTTYWISYMESDDYVHAYQNVLSMGACAYANGFTYASFPYDPAPTIALSNQLDTMFITYTANTIPRKNTAHVFDGSMGCQ
jgi:hypothetical protein